MQTIKSSLKNKKYSSNSNFLNKRSTQASFKNSEGILIIDFNNFLNLLVKRRLLFLDKDYYKNLYLILQNLISNIESNYNCKLTSKIIYIGVSPRLPLKQKEKLNNFLFKSLRSLDFLISIKEGSFYNNPEEDDIFFNSYRDTSSKQGNESKYKANLDNLIFVFLSGILLKDKSYFSNQRLNSEKEKPKIFLISGDKDFLPMLKLMKNNGFFSVQLSSKVNSSSELCKSNIFSNILKVI